MFDADTANTLRKAAQLLNAAADTVEAGMDLDCMEYVDEQVVLALAELEEAGYDLDDLVSYARNIA